MPNFNPLNPTKFLGTNKYITFFVTRNREPTGADFRQPETGTLYSIGTIWQVGKDPTTGVEGELWILSKIVANVAYWVKIGTGTTGPVIGFNVPFGSSPVFPDGAGFVTYTSTAGTITITGSTNTINFDLSGGSVGVDSFQVDAFTAPGTNPVLPTAAGLVTITGAQVAAGTTTNVIRTDSLAANTYTIEIQRSQAVASTTIGDNGVSHFNSNQFTVDANAFVSLIGGKAVNQIKNQVFTASGTYTPTANMIFCQITCLGGGAAGGGASMTGAAQVSTGAGGGGGEYAVGIFSAATIGVSQTVTIGAGGIGVSASSGGNGGNTSVGSLISANGGTGGSTAISSGVNTPGGLGGTGGTGGDYRTPGSSGVYGWGFVIGTDFVTNGGKGANTQIGAGGNATPTTSAGSIGLGYGAGGSGANNIPSAGADLSGGNGTAGIVIVQEFITG